MLNYGVDNAGSDKQGYAVYASLFEYEPSRSQRRMIQIIEGAIANYASIGIDKTTYEKIAETCNISRPLIQHYFKNKDAIFEMAVKYIRSNFQQLAAAAVSEQKTPTKKLEAYLNFNFEWMKQFPLHSKVWMLFYYYCGIEKKYRKLNTDLVAVGHDRIRRLLSEGKESKSFCFDDESETAKLIQHVLNGVLLAAATEEVASDLEELKERTVRSSLALLQASKVK